MVMKDLPVLSEQEIEKLTQRSGDVWYELQYKNEIALFYCGHILDFKNK